MSELGEQQCLLGQLWPYGLEKVIRKVLLFKLKVTVEKGDGQPRPPRFQSLKSKHALGLQGARLFVVLTVKAHPQPWKSL